ncbi:uncharacterized protein HMPREF1541_04165 [Cyphellophora europaea CBS 101466]|uniref:Uncharacterized protein n=1 Tax=Cyphellophora europaea (strain CBS 101466) TaxID=1220924 RepID=W2S2N2_CYPE1|nr:uncharacterized protein HMPREF1541_04165 [Cyphellophora europaea CBS 101466]ETN42224.1 hypothetical protein HMPREF1541_04165 [Cyphellophora europaea CBS 101466]
MENEPADFLQVPITERERVEARRRSTSIERLLPDAESVYSQPFEDDRQDLVSPVPSRFASVRGESSQPRRFHSYQGNQYAPISPIDEEDIADAASDVPSRPRTIPQSEKSFEPLVPLPDLWTPIWLRRSTLAVFIAFFVVSIVALIILWVLSATRTGFDVHFDGPHHAWWVYVPTIAVVLLVGLWRQVDYHTKTLMPWDELQRGPVTASKSLLLNYVSPLQIVALFQAFVHNHIPIVATVSSFMFLKIITVFSTGLFILLPKNVSQGNFPLLSLSRFDAAITNDATSAPVSAYYGSVYQGIPFQPGVAIDLAYAPFQYDESRDEEIAENATFSADVDAFVPTISCRAVDVTLDGDSTRQQSSTGDVFGDGIRIRIPSDSTCDNWAAMVISALNPQLQVAPSNQVYGSLQALSCGTGEPPGALLFTVLNLGFEQDLRDGSVQLALAGEDVATSSSRTVTNMTNVICEAGHTLTTIKVSNNTLEMNTPSQGVTLEPADNVRNRTLDNLSDGDVMATFAATVSAGGSQFGEVQGADNTSGFFTLMALHHGTRDVSRLLNTDDLSRAAEVTFKGVMAQYAHLSLSQPTGEEIRGSAQRMQTRYVVNDPSAALMIGALVVSIVAAFILLFSAPRAVVPRDPGSIAAVAATLTNSIELNRLLRRGGVPSENNQEAALDGYEFGTAIATTEHGQASFKVVASEGIKDHNAPKPENTLKWWHPITASIPFALFVLAIPIVLIGMLELTQKRSEDGGILNVPDNQATDIFTHYIPSLVMIIVASLLNLLDFNILVFTPCSALAAGGATAQKSILAHYLGITSPWALFEAIKVRHINVVLSTIATLIASILAIVAAGLYNVDSFDTVGSAIALSSSSRFTLEWPNSANTDNGAAGIINAVLHDNLSYPAFTYRSLVFPTFSLDNGDLETGNGSTRTTATNSTKITLDALMPDLQCYRVDRNFMTIFNDDNGQVTVDILATLPDSCQLAGTSGAGSFIDFSNTFNVPSDSSTVFGGRQNDLLFGSGAELIGNTLNTTTLNLSSLIADNPPVGCPSLAFTYGRFSANTTSADVSSMLCYQQIQTVRASFALIGNTTAIDVARGVSIDATDAQLLANPLSTDGDDKVFNMHIQRNLAWQMRPFAATADPAAFDLDAFFQGVLNPDDAPTRPLDPESLAGEDNDSELLGAVLDFYRLYMAQAISMNMRDDDDNTNSNNGTQSSSSSSSSSSSPSPPLSRRQAPAPLATIDTTISTPRLIQSRTSKLLLQVLLALTTLLSGTAWLLTRFRRVLPLDPNSVAGTMSLLAGSDLAHCVDDGLCECCGKPRRNSFGTVAEADAEAEAAEAEEEGGPLGAGRGGRVSVHAPSFVTAAGGIGAEREGVIPVGAEWYQGHGRGRRRGGGGRWNTVFSGKRFSSGWWAERRDRGRRRRWGVDVGDRADGSAADEDWELGPRRLKAGSDVGPGMRFEMRDFMVGRGAGGPRDGGGEGGSGIGGLRGRSLEVPAREGAYGYGYGYGGSGYGEGGLRGEDTSMERGRGMGISAAASEAGSREGSVDVGEGDERGRHGGGDGDGGGAGAGAGFNFSRGGYSRVAGDGDFRGEA